MKILFMGTPDFAASSLETLFKSGYDVCGVISQPDKPKNRGMQMIKTPVKICAEKYNARVYQPDTLKDGAILDYLNEISPDIIVVVAYGKFLPKYILEYPKYGCINIHASLLPKYRGAAPIQYSILSGDKVTGVTSMYMDNGMDTGDMIYKTETPIRFDETAEELHDRLADMGASLLCKTLDAIEEGNAPRIKQNNEDATYAHMLTKEMGKINWNESAEKIICRIRGLYPWPGAYSFADGKKFKILSALICEKTGKPGEILDKKNDLIIAAKEKSVKIEKLQFENKRAMTPKQYFAGNDIKEILVD